VLSGFVINGNVFNHAINERAVPEKHQQRRLTWFIVTLVTVSGSFALANLLPDLSALISVVGATCGLALTFVFPASIMLKLQRKQHTGTYKMVVHWVVLGIALVCLGVCSYATIYNLVHTLSKSAHHPFAC